MATTIEGFASDRYGLVADAFQKVISEQPKGGASLSIFKDGKEVVSLWGGSKNENQAWEKDTASTIFSCTKGLLAIMAARLVQEGILDLDAPVAKYWPEFAQNEKQNIPVRWLLEHRAGLSATVEDISVQDVIDYQPVVDALAKQKPIWEPGTGHAYHALTFGHLIGRVIYGATGIRTGDYFRRLISEPLSAESWIGIPKSVRDRVAYLYTDSNRQSTNPELGSDGYWLERSMTLGNAFGLEIAGEGTGFNNPAVQESEFAGAGGISTASSLAKIWSAAVVTTDGVRLIEDEAIKIFTEPAISGPSVFNDPGPWCVRGLGFMVHSPGYRASIGKNSFGHDGLGGQTCFADTEHKIGFAFITNYLASGDQEHGRQISLVNSLKQTLEN